MNIAVVGSNGFIGKHLISVLEKNTENKLFLFGKNKQQEENKNLTYFRLDLNHPEQLKTHFKEIDLVYYLVSETIPATSWEKPLTEIEKNLVPFINFLEHIVTFNVKKVVFVSSAGTVYGTTNEKVNEQSSTNPFSPYGITKLSMEHFLGYFQKKHNLQYDIFRVSNVYGPGQNTSKGLGIINTFIENILSERKIHIFGDGKNVRNYIYVKDVAKILALSSKVQIQNSAVYNLASDNTLSIVELIKIIKRIVSEEFETVFLQTRGSDNVSILLDNSKLKKTFPEYKLTSIEKGIEETYMYIKEKAHKKQS